MSVRLIVAQILRPTPTLDLDGLVVEAVSQLPDDESPSSEGNDAVHAEDSELAIRLGVSQGAAVPGPRVVPFVRTIRPRMTGLDVTAMQRALIAAKVRKLAPTGWHGPISVGNVKAFQRSRKIEPSGVYGPATHHALLGNYDAYGAFLMMQARKQAQEHAVRQRIVATALFGVAVRDRIAYSQGPERMYAVEHKLRPPRFPAATDCSGFAVWCYQVAGAPDPCGFGYSVGAGAHWTGSMRRVGRRTTNPQIGDLCLYGRPPDFEHVTIYAGNGKCVSHGSPPGPLVVPVRYRPVAEYRTYL